ncbi:MAG: outer membrane beta-barrel protein [Cyclobacteriaceae bacterium]
MKKIIVLLVFVAGVATTGYSQFIKQGTILGGGAFEYKSHKDDADFKQSSLSLSPWAGYMVIDNFAVGALLSVSTTTQKSGASDFKNTRSDILFGPVARYYMDNGLFAHGQFGFGPGKSKNESGGTTTTTKFSISELRLGAGYAVRISDTVLFEPIAGYLSQSSKNKSSNVKNTESGFFLMAGFTIFFHSTN